MFPNVIHTVSYVESALLLHNRGRSKCTAVERFLFLLYLPKIAIATAVPLLLLHFIRLINLKGGKRHCSVCVAALPNGVGFGVESRVSDSAS